MATQTKRFCNTCGSNAAFTCVEVTKVERTLACNCCGDTVTTKRRHSAKAAKREATVQWLLAN